MISLTVIVLGISPALTVAVAIATPVPIRCFFQLIATSLDFITWISNPSDGLPTFWRGIFMLLNCCQDPILWMCNSWFSSMSPTLSIIVADSSPTFGLSTTTISHNAISSLEYHFMERYPGAPASSSFPTFSSAWDTFSSRVVVL